MGQMGNSHQALALPFIPAPAHLIQRTKRERKIN